MANGKVVFVCLPAASEWEIVKLWLAASNWFGGALCIYPVIVANYQFQRTRCGVLPPSSLHSLFACLSVSLHSLPTSTTIIANKYVPSAIIVVFPNDLTKNRPENGSLARPSFPGPLFRHIEWITRYFLYALHFFASHAFRIPLFTEFYLTLQALRPQLHVRTGWPSVHNEQFGRIEWGAQQLAAVTIGTPEEPELIQR